MVRIWDICVHVNLNQFNNILGNKTIIKGDLTIPAFPKRLKSYTKINHKSRSSSRSTNKAKDVKKKKIKCHGQGSNFIPHPSPCRDKTRYRRLKVNVFVLCSRSRLKQKAMKVSYHRLDKEYDGIDSHTKTELKLAL